MKKTQTNVLVVFANPRGTDPLRLANEDRAIREALKLARYRDKFAPIVPLHAATIHDLRRALMEKAYPVPEEGYHIVHISGHSTKTGLILENEAGGKYTVPQQALADLFQVYSPPRGVLRCLIMNACYSVFQGKLTSLGTPYTIAMEGPIGDTAAIEFSRGFYDALGAGYDIEAAYEQGLLCVKLSVPNAIWHSKLLKQGEVYEAEQPDSQNLSGEEGSGQGQGQAQSMEEQAEIGRPNAHYAASLGPASGKEVPTALEQNPSPPEPVHRTQVTNKSGSVKGRGHIVIQGGDVRASIHRPDSDE